MSSQSQALNWLFAMNTGGVAGVLAYAASKDSSPFIIFALVAFSTGLLALIGYSACMHYFGARECAAYHKDLNQLYTDKIDWTEFVERENNRPNKSRLCETLAWISAIAGGLGITFSSYAIL